MSKELIAHVVRSDDGSWATPHFLSKHLEGTARLAEGFASKFQSREWGNLLGLAHDAGKGRFSWQEYIKKKSGYDEEAHLEGKIGKIPHAIHGAELVESLFGRGIGRILAYCIAGHHAGLPDWSSAEGTGQASLEFQKSQVKDLDQIDASIVNRIREAKPLHPPWKFSSGLDLSLWIRMLFSCLVDADFLDTEEYMNPEAASNRSRYRSIAELLEEFHRNCRKLDERSGDTDKKVNKIRKQIRETCMQRAKDKQGVFSLTVPTGGGKTISGLAFALEHAKFNNLDRIIYVSHYGSITEQNANVFRNFVGEDQVVEHHSNVDDNDTTTKSRLAAENWDAPLIVTTTVQFFESLFSSKPSRCRKLHNIARSVVILDEAQLVPVEFLGPILETMRLLVERYHVSFVISTATQPAFQERMVDGRLFKGLKEIKEIMGKQEEIQRLYHDLTRNRIHFPVDLDAATNWEEIAAELVKYEQVLCIVSDRKSCRELHQLMPEGTYHLSALMCGQHRSEVIREMKERLKDRLPVRAISTQLVEAGVDLDFPVVYRAFAGLDSITQAAGRCNREGELSGLGKVVVFIPPRKAPEGILRKSEETTKSILMTNDYDVSNYTVFQKFYEELYWRANSIDTKNIVSLLDPNHNDPSECSMFFRTASNQFKIIDDTKHRTILVRYKEGNRFIDIVKEQGPSRWLLRKLQRYTVTIYANQFDSLLRKGIIEEVYPKMFVLTSKLAYSERIGLLVEEAAE